MDVSEQSETSELELRDDTVLMNPPPRPTPLRKACNECRQQKLRCDAGRDGVTSCSRCVRLRIECRIDANFERVEKRKQRRERRQSIGASGVSNVPNTLSPSFAGSHQFTQDTTQSFIPPLENPQACSVRQMGEVGTSSQEPVWVDNLSPINPALFQTNDERSEGQDLGPSNTSRKIDRVNISGSAARQLFNIFFTHYHPFLPFLDPQKSPDTYYQESPFLYWAIIGVASRRYSSDLTLLPALSVSVPRLFWSTLQSASQNYHNCKALCLLSVWPFPKSDSTNDPTFVLVGIMMHLAIQSGLHMPNHAQDFSKGALSLCQEDIRDRYTTWITCNIVAQSVATGLGHPSSSKYDWCLEGNQRENQDLSNRLRIEMFCDQVAHALYDNNTVRQNSFNSEELSSKFHLLSQEFMQLQSDLSSSGISTQTILYLRCAQVHLHLFALFNLEDISRLLSLYQVCSQFLREILPSQPDGLNILSYCPYYVFQMVLACGFTLLKLLRSSFSRYVDGEAGKLLFNSTISACRQISISNNDLPGRLGEVLAQLWAWGNSEAQDTQGFSTIRTELLDSPLILRGRMSMSIVYDSLSRWRKVFMNDTARNLALSAPTKPALGNDWDSPQKIDDNGNVVTEELIQNESGDLPNLDWITNDTVAFLDVESGFW